MKVQGAAIISIDENNKIGLLNLVQLANEKDRQLVTEFENKWREFYPHDIIRTIVFPGSKSEFAEHWRKPTESFMENLYNSLGLKYVKSKK